MIEIRNVSKTFHLKEQTIQAVDDVSLRINDGDIYGVIGYSGAGKSTLVRCINFLEKPDIGEIQVSDFGTITAKKGKLFYKEENSEVEKPATEKQLNVLRKKIGMIFQHFNLLDRSTVYENIAFPLKHSGKSKQEIHDRVFELLRLVDLEDRANSYPAELSGGQKQRVAIARALANNPKILLSDEATSALDPDATESILNLLKDLNRKLGLTVIMITHEMAVIKQICHKVAVMENGRVVEEGTVYDIFHSPQESITKKFVSSSSNIDRIGKILQEDASLVQTSENAQILQLQFGTDSVGDALISEVSRDFAVNLNIILANVEILQGKPLGRMVVQIQGSEDNITKAIAHMKNCNVKVEVIDHELA